MFRDGRICSIEYINSLLDHGLLLGRTDDDHTQYWIAGTARTGNFSTSGTLGAGAITGTSLTASVASGNVFIKAQTASAGQSSYYSYGHQLGSDGVIGGFAFFNNNDSVAQFYAKRMGNDDAAAFMFGTQATGVPGMVDRLTISSTGNFDFASGNMVTLGTLGAGATTLDSLIVDTDALTVNSTTHKTTVNENGIGLYDPGEEYYLCLQSNADTMNADRILYFDTIDADRTITLSGSPTLGNWFDQSVKIAASPTLAGLTLTGNLIIPDGGLIGSASDPDAIQIEADGDVVLTKDLYIAQYIKHTSDADTYIEFGPDTFYFIAGGLRFMQASESEKGADSMIFNGNQADIDFVVRTVGHANALLVQGSDGAVTVSASLRGATSLWWRIQHVDIASIPALGAVGATYTPQSANNLSGYKLDNAPSEEYLYFNTHIGTDWDAASDLEFVVQFETNVDNSGGLVTDTVNFDLLMYYKGDGETTQKTQDLDASVVVGQAAQYYHEQVVFTIDYDKVDHVVQIGDCVSWRLHLNTTDSEVDNVIVHRGMFRYKTNKVRAEV